MRKTIPGKSVAGELLAVWGIFVSSCNVELCWNKPASSQLWVFRRAISVASCLLIFQVLLLSEGRSCPYQFLYAQNTSIHVLVCCFSPPHPHDRAGFCGGPSSAGSGRHSSVEISANDPRLLPGVFGVTLPDCTWTKRHL